MGRWYDLGHWPSTSLCRRNSRWTSPFLAMLASNTPNKHDQKISKVYDLQSGLVSSHSPTSIELCIPSPVAPGWIVDLGATDLPQLGPKPVSTHPAACFAAPRRIVIWFSDDHGTDPLRKEDCSGECSRKNIYIPSWQQDSRHSDRFWYDPSDVECQVLHQSLHDLVYSRSKNHSGLPVLSLLHLTFGILDTGVPQWSHPGSVLHLWGTMPGSIYSG